MKRKTLAWALIIIIVLVVAASAYLMFQSRAHAEKFCEDVRDCACGMRVGTGDCFYGNKNFVDTGRQCPDFCNGIGANLEIQCVRNECRQVSVGSG